LKNTIYTKYQTVVAVNELGETSASSRRDQMDIKPTPTYYDDQSVSEFSKVPAPPAMYKYRSLPVVDTDEYLFTELLESKVYFAGKHQLNDPNEFDAEIEVDTSDEAILQVALDHVRDNHPNGGDDFWMQKAAEMIQLLPSDEEQRRIEFDRNSKNIIDNIGVYSISSVPNSRKMWKEYADRGSGFCIEYDTRNLYYSLTAHLGVVLLDVKYSNEQLVLDVNRNRDWPLWLFSSKRTKWSYEREWRFMGQDLAGTLIDIPKSAVNRVLVLQGSNAANILRLKGVRRELIHEIEFELWTE
jgi:hypothetical protein